MKLQLRVNHHGIPRDRIVPLPKPKPKQEKTKKVRRKR
jgi:hypothetical protein